MSPKYVCLNCGMPFDTAKKYVERHGLDTPPYEEYYGCPVCGGAFTRVDIFTRRDPYEDAGKFIVI